MYFAGDCPGLIACATRAGAALGQASLHCLTPVAGWTCPTGCGRTPTVRWTAPTLRLHWGETAAVSAREVQLQNKLDLVLSWHMLQYLAYLPPVGLVCD